MSAADTAHAAERAVATYREHGDNGAAYLLLALAILAQYAPEVVEYVLDRADDVARRWP